MHLTRRPRHYRLNPESIRLPLIALIDVVLFLLLYFVISTSYEAEERELGTTLATEGASGSTITPEVVTILWSDGSARYRIDALEYADRASLTVALRALPVDTGLVISAAADAPVQVTAGAVQAGRDAGFTRISFKVAPPAPMPAVP